MSPPRAVVVGLAGTTLAPAERRRLAEGQPLGCILFRRNVEDRPQLRALCSEIRTALGRADAPILVDQEGGRVARLAPPVWRAYPPAARLGALAERDRTKAVATAGVLAQRIGLDLAEVGIDWVCAPVADLRLAETHAAIGDRAFAADPAVVADLAGAMIAGFRSAGVVAILKHAPGHGRARVDPHLALPTVTAPRATLAADFAPFRALAGVPAAMVAHVVYTALDGERPASCSPRVVELVRHELGLAGLLFSDDVDMGALAGGTGARVRAVLAAGLAAALQCTGVPADLDAALAAAPPLSTAARKRLDAARPLGERSRAEAAALDAALDEALGAALD